MYRRTTLANVKQGRLFSDDHTVLFEVVLLDYAVDQQKVSYRKTARINWGTFENYILHRISNIDTASPDLNECLDLYSTSLSKVLDAHAPLKVKSVSVRKTIPWLNDDMA